MTLPPLPSYDKRRRLNFEKELLDRARLWLPEWSALKEAGDPGAAVLKIAAKLESQVTQRLDRLAEKSFRGFLHWLNVRGTPGRAARIPLAFRMAARSEAVLAEPPIQVQADAGGEPVIFETEQQLRIVPGSLAAVLAADPASDRFFGPFEGLSPWEAPKPRPNEWRLAAAAAGGSPEIQLDPPTGLEAGDWIKDEAQNRYRVVGAKDGLVTIEPGLGITETSSAPPDAPAGIVFERLTAFDPFGTNERDQQQHAFYFGSETGLDIKTAAFIEITGGPTKQTCQWSYWGKEDKGDKVDWVKLDQEKVAGRILLWKPAGSIEPREIGGKPSRWLRAKPQPPERPQPPKPNQPMQERVRSLHLQLNCELSDTLKSKLEKSGEAEPIELEGIANTSPLVFATAFYPLGREPRLFDSFYLGCKEAFSKAKATVTIHIEAGESFSAPIISVTLLDTKSLVAGIGGDGRLRIITIDDVATAVAAGVPDFVAPTLPRDTKGQPISLTIGLRPGAAAIGTTAYVSAAAANEVWLWNSAAPRGTDPWKLLGTPDPQANVTDTVLALSEIGNSVIAYAVAGGTIYKRDAPNDAAWSKVAPPPPDGAKIARLAAFIDPAEKNGSQKASLGLVAVTTDGALLRFRVPDGASPSWNILYPEKIDTTVYPMALVRGGPEMVFAARAKKVKEGTKDEHVEQWAVAVDADGTGRLREAKCQLVGRSFGAVRAVPGLAEDPAVIFFGKKGNNVCPMIWKGLEGTVPIEGSRSADNTGQYGAPVQHLGKYVVPEAGGSLALAQLFPEREIPGTRVMVGLLVNARGEWGGQDNLLIDLTPNAPQRRKMVGAKAFDVGARHTFFLVDESVAQPNATDIAVYRALTEEREATWNSAEQPGEPGQLTLHPDENVAAKDGFLFVFWGTGQPTQRVVQIATYDEATKIATLTTNLPASTNKHVSYRNVMPLQSEDHEKIFSATPHSALTFPEAQDFPLDQTTTALIDNKPYKIEYAIDGMTTVILSDVVDSGTPEVVTVDLVSKSASQTTYAPPRPRSPELSWEYWNGQSWWKIVVTTDTTGYLVSSGDIIFDVPDDLKPSDVVGRNNYWIRARLIGGDYGQEAVTLSPAIVGEPQTVTRDASGIRAPYLTSIRASYELCTKLLPDAVLTQDSGGYLDQTAANASPNAEVQIFTPLKNALPRGSVRIATSTGAASADCGCDDHAGTGAGPADADAETDRAIYLGFDAPLQGDSLALLFLVNDATDDGAFPLAVEAFADGIFAPIAVKDGTRGLSESGVLTLSLPKPLLEASYFGRSLHWLRLKPRAGFEATRWRPQIRAVYLNAAFARAAETQKLEILGSSDGSPGLKVSVARPPVINGSLELRIREPLGEEDIVELNKSDPDRVKTKVGPWQGAWVRWTEDILAAADGTARVFDLDASTGEIVFGDGRHGRIPPIGRDNIVAVTYQRLGGAAANRVTAWGQLNLITPISGVEATIAPEGAAGGSSPQGAEAALRFAPANLRMRDRALTLGDIEQLALQSSPDIAQVKALRTATGVRVVQIMRGSAPVPTNAARRELAAYLRERTPPEFSVPGALIVDKPVIVEGRISLRLIVSDLALGGSVTAEAIKRVLSLLDPAIGGLDSSGWPLGMIPDEADIAARLSGIENLVDVEKIEITLAAGNRRVLRPTELFAVGADGVSVITEVDQGGAG
ncbi:hypothetical protein [Bradyrhizobium sp. USDA 3315]